MFAEAGASVGVYVVSFGVAVLSGLVPVVSAELYVVGIALVAGNVHSAVTVGFVVALGQMVAKSFLYHASRGAADLSTRRGSQGGRIVRARALVSKWQNSPLTLCFISASIGLPPFYLVTIAAGLLKIRFRTFLLTGFLGRAVRFVSVAVIAVSR